MVRAAQKGEGASSPEVAQVANDISMKDAKKFAKTKHKGLPEKKIAKEEVSMQEAFGFKDFRSKLKKVKEKQPQKAMDAGAKARRVLKRKEHAKYVSGSTENVPDDIRDHYEVSEDVKPEPPEEEQKDKEIASKQKRQMQIKKQVLLKKMQAVRAGAGADIVASHTPEGELVEGDYHSGQGEKIEKRTKKWMSKKGQEGAPGLDAMKARTAEHKAKRGVKFKVKVKEDAVNEGAAWTKKSGKNPEGGLNEKGRKSYERENPGSNLKAPQPEGGSRKKSFCARMGGMKKKLTSSKTANDPDSRINKALRKWKC